MIAEALCMFFYAPLSSFYPLMTSDYFKLSAMYGSAVELSFAIGMMVSSLLFSSVLKINRKIRVSFIGLFAMGVMSLICGIIPPAYVGWFFFAGSCICLGASGNVHTIPLTAYMQETISPDKMGRAFSVSHADFICYNANRLTFQQSYSRKSRCECVVLHFRSVYDYAYYWCFNTICGKMQDILDNYQERIRQLK